jgi:hypothetical protein
MEKKKLWRSLDLSNGLNVATTYYTPEFKRMKMGDSEMGEKFKFPL